MNYTCKAKNAKVRLNSEAQSYKWVTAENALNMKLNEPTKELLGPVPLNYGLLLACLSLGILAVLITIKIFRSKKIKAYVDEFWYLSQKIRSWLGDNEVEPDLKEYKKLLRLYKKIEKSPKVVYEEKTKMFNEVKDIYQSIEREEIESKVFKVYSEGQRPLEEFIEMIQKGPIKYREEKLWSRVPTPKLFDNLINIPLPPEPSPRRYFIPRSILFNRQK